MEAQSLLRAAAAPPPLESNKSGAGRTCRCGVWVPLTLDFFWERHRSRLVTVLSLVLVLQTIFVDGLAGFTIQQCVAMYAAANPLGPKSQFNALPTFALQVAFIIFGGLAASGYHHRLWIVVATVISVALLTEQSRETKSCVALATGGFSELSVCTLMLGASGSCDGLSAYLTVGATAAINSVSWVCTAVAALRLAWLLATHVLLPCCRRGMRSLCYGDCAADADREACTTALMVAARQGFPGYSLLQRLYAYGHFVPLRIMLALLVVGLFLIIFPMWLSSATKALVASVTDAIASIPPIYRPPVIFDTAIPLFVAGVAAVAYSQVFAITVVLCGSAATVWLAVSDHIAHLQQGHAKPAAGESTAASSSSKLRDGPSADFAGAGQVVEPVGAALPRGTGSAPAASASCCDKPCLSLYTASGVLPDGSLNTSSFAYLDAPDILYLFVANALVVYVSTTALFTVVIALFIFAPTRSYAIATFSTALVTSILRLLTRLVLSKVRQLCAGAAACPKREGVPNAI